MSSWRATRSPAWGAIGLVALIALYGFPLVEMARLALTGVGGRPGLSMETVRDLVSDPRLHRVLRFTLAETAGTVLVTVAVGVAVSWVLARYRWPGRSFLGAVVLVPFVLPSVVVGGAVHAMARGTAVPPLVLIVVAHVIFNLGLVVRPVTTAFETVGRRAEDAARVSVNSGRIPVARAVLRAVGPTVASAGLLVGVLALTSFGVVTVLGGASDVNLEVEIWYRTTRLLDMAAGVVLAAVQIGVVGGMVFLTGRLRGSGEREGTRSVGRRPRGAAQWSAVAAASATVGAISVVPLVSIVAQSFRVDGGWSLANYRRWSALGAGTTAQVDLGAVLGRSLAAASTALVVAGLIAVPVTWFASGSTRSSRRARHLVTLVLGVSAATLGFGYVAAFSGPMLDLRGTAAIVAMVQAAVIAPFMVRMALPAVRSMNHRSLDAAAALGAGLRRRSLSIAAPQLWRPMAGVLGFGFALAVGEFGATTFVGRSDAATAPVLIGQLLGRPGSSSIGHGYALAVILSVMSVAVFAVADALDNASRMRRGTRRRARTRAGLAPNSVLDSLR